MQENVSTGLKRPDGHGSRAGKALGEEIKHLKSADSSDLSSKKPGFFKLG
jgi:hypothetical protein